MSRVLTEYRKQSGIRQADIAAALGVHPPTLSKWERKRVPAERVLDVERVTGISRFDLRPDLYPRDPFVKGKTPFFRPEGGPEEGSRESAKEIEQEGAA